MVTEGGKVEGAQEMHLRAGQALLFQDSLVHGAAARVNPNGWRRTLCFRYLPQDYSTDRFGNKFSSVRTSTSTCATNPN